MKLILVILILTLRSCSPCPAATASWFDANGLTCASWFYPLGTKLKVTSDEWQVTSAGSSTTHHTSLITRSVTVTVNDRGPAWRLVRAGRVIDLSGEAMDALTPPNLSRPGLMTVKIEMLKGQNEHKK